MRLGLVANTKSGAADRADEVARALRAAGAQVEEIPLDRFCDGPESVDEQRLAETARDLQADRIVVAGGDGSIGPASLLALRMGLPLAVVPIGTANSFARWLDLSLELDEAVQLAARSEIVTRPAEVAEAGGRPFVNVAATGLSVLAAHQARPFKGLLGPLAYAVGAVRAAVTGRPLHVVVRCDGEERWRGDAWQVLVAATGAFGGESSTGGVDTDDHQLDVAIVEAGARIKLAARALSMRQGRLVHDDEVRHVRGRVVELDTGKDRDYNVDGEIIDITASRFSVLGTVEVVTG